MPNKKHEWITCLNYSWKLFQRNEVWYADGRPKQRKYSLGTRHEQEARRNLARLDDAIAKHELKKLTDPTVKKEQAVAIEEGWRLYIESGNRPGFLQGHSPETTKKYNSMKARSTAFLAEQRVGWWHQLSENHLVEYAKAFDGQLSPRTIHHEVTMLVSVSNWLIRKKLISAECKLHLKLRKPDDSEAYCYTEEQVAAILEHCSSSAKLRQIDLLCRLLSHTGMRLGEALALRWSDIDFHSDFITIRDESFAKKSSRGRRRVKDKSTRRVPIAAGLHAELVAARPGSLSGWVFKSRTGQPLMQNNVREKFIRLVSKPLSKRFRHPKGEPGFRDGRFHSFRHFFVSQCFVQGVDEGTIRSWLGHSDSRILELYRHLAEKDSQRLMQKLDFSGKAKDE
jgi:integrase